MNKLGIVAVTLAAMFFVCSHAQTNCGNGHWGDDLERTETICGAGMSSCCPRLQSLNFTCLCSSSYSIPNIIRFARRTCNIRVPQLGQCQENCREGTSEDDFDRINRVCEVGLDSCCRRLESLNFDCMCSPNSGVIVPQSVLNYARNRCRIAVEPVEQCPAGN